jgi:hypothetical protein
MMAEARDDRASATATDGCRIWGPYVALAAGNYEVKYYFEAIGLGEQDAGGISPVRAASQFASDAKISLDVSRDIGRETLAAVTLAEVTGEATLREGTASLRFTNDKPGALFEFRFFTWGQPFRGRLRFFGATLERLGPALSQDAAGFRPYAPAAVARLLRLTR